MTTDMTTGPTTDPTNGHQALTIDCDDCVRQHTETCDDCVVTFLCSREPDEAVVIEVGEVRALRLLADSGLTPPLRHRRRTG
jgi:hypothetical protein